MSIEEDTKTRSKTLSSTQCRHQLRFNRKINDLQGQCCNKLISVQCKTFDLNRQPQPCISGKYAKLLLENSLSSN